MSNPYYTHGGVPVAGSAGSSAIVRAEFDAIGAGFDLLPALATNGSKVVVINGGGTAMTVTVGTLALAGNFATTGAYNTTLIQTASVSLTLPGTSGTLALAGGINTWSGVQTFSAQPILSTLTASQAVFTDGSKGLVSNAITGSGNVVMSTSPTLVTPILGTPTSGTLTSCTGLPAAGVVGTAAVLGDNTFTGNQTLSASKSIKLPAVGIADQSWCGISETGTSAAALAFGELCYFVTATSKWDKAKADVVGTSANKLGICILAAAGVDAATAMLLWGKVRADSLYPTMGIGAPVYVSAATAGEVTSTAPTGTTDFVVRKIGFANSGDELFFNPSNDYITLV